MLASPHTSVICTDNWHLAEASEDLCVCLTEGSLQAGAKDKYHEVLSQTTEPVAMVSCQAGHCFHHFLSVWW